MFRAVVAARDGLAAMFGGLSPRVALSGNVVRIRLASDMTYRRTTADVGLTLVPTLFSRNASTPISPDEPPMVMYGARHRRAVGGPSRRSPAGRSSA